MYISTIHSYDSLEKLKKAGIDGVIIGIPVFSIRNSNEVKLEELNIWKHRCNELGLELYINCLKFVHEQELDLLEDTFKILKEIDVDGIYYGDEGVLYCAKQYDMAYKMIYQPETLITSSNDVLFYLNEGCKSVSLAHELSLEEIEDISKVVNNIEILIQGYYSIMYSRRTLVQNYFDAIVKNIDLNKSYTLIEQTRKDKMPIIQDDKGTNVYSEAPMKSLKQMSTFKELGISRFRIDSLFYDDDWTCSMMNHYLNNVDFEDESSDHWYYQESITKKGA